MHWLGYTSNEDCNDSGDDREALLSTSKDCDDDNECL